MTAVLPSTEQVWDWLGEVPDPEIPVVSVTELGIVREVRWEGETLVVAVTPTYSGCPATSVIDLMIETRLREKGITDLRLGSTPCKASYRCRDCLEPFDYFKCH